MSADINEYGLSRNEVAIIAAVLAPFSAKLDEGCIIGSRATGGYTDYSDIDIVLYGALTRREVARLHTLFGESSLGLRVDVKNYHDISYAPLLRHIDSCVKILFTKAALETFAQSRQSA